MVRWQSDDQTQIIMKFDGALSGFNRHSYANCQLHFLAFFYALSSLNVRCFTFDCLLFALMTFDFLLECLWGGRCKCKDHFFVQMQRSLSFHPETWSWKSKARLFLCVYIAIRTLETEKTTIKAYSTDDLTDLNPLFNRFSVIFLLFQ